MAAPGGIAVSGKAYHEAGKRLSVTLADAGPHRFKNIDEPVHVWTWRLAGGTACTRGEPRPKLRPPTCRPQYRTAIVGVLPFANLSESADEYFSDGLTEDLIHALSLQSFYRVLSRNSTFAFKGKNVSTRLIAREIDATYLIQGSVRRAGDQDSRHRRADRAGDRRAIMDRPLRPRHRRPVRDAGRDHHQPVGGDRRRDLPGGSIRPAHALVERPHRVGPFPQGAVALLPADQGGFRNLDRPVQGGHRARSDACRSRAPISPPSRSRASSSDGSRARANCGTRRCHSRRAASGSIRVRPLRFDSRLRARDGRALRGGDGCRQAGGRAQSVRHGRPRRAWACVISYRRTPARHRTVFDGGAARQQRSPISMGGRERVQPLPARAV